MLICCVYYFGFFVCLGLICRACTKPNTISTTFCTGCGFPCTEDDIQRLPDNIFLQLVKGEDIGAKVKHTKGKQIHDERQMQA